MTGSCMYSPLRKMRSTRNSHSHTAGGSERGTATVGNTSALSMKGPGWVAQLAGASSRNEKVAGSIPSRGVYRRQLIDVSVSH